MAFEEGPFSRVSAAGELVRLDGSFSLGAGSVPAPIQNCEGPDTCGRNAMSQQGGYNVFIDNFFLGVKVIEFDAENCESVKNERGLPKVIEEWDDFWEHSVGGSFFTRVERFVSVGEQPAGEGLCNKNNPGRVDLFFTALEHDGLCCSGPESFQVLVRYYPFTEEGTNSFSQRTGTISKPLNVNFDSAPGTYMKGVWQLVEIISYEIDTFRLFIYDSLWRKVGGVETRWPSF